MVYPIDSTEWDRNGKLLAGKMIGMEQVLWERGLLDDLAKSSRGGKAVSVCTTVRCPKRLKTRLQKQLSLAKNRLIQELMELLTSINVKQRCRISSAHTIAACNVSFLSRLTPKMRSHFCSLSLRKWGISVYSYPSSIVNLTPLRWCIRKNPLEHIDKYSQHSSGSRVVCTLDYSTL
jgi:hypothetical protein